MKLFEALGFLLLLTIGVISSCSPPPRTKSERKVEEKTSFLPEYRLGFGDVVEVKFFNNANFNETVAVRPDGRITMEKIGDIFVVGMTPSQLDTLITDAYAKFIRNPEVTVFVRQFGGYQVYVLGEVNTPGGYPIQRNMNLLQALAAAGGPKETAKLRSVMILRRGEKKEEINSFKVDLMKPMQVQGSNYAVPEDEFYVQAQDVIYVPRTFIANASTFMKQIYDGLLPPLDIYLRILLWSNR